MVSVRRDTTRPKPIVRLIVPAVLAALLVQTGPTVAQTGRGDRMGYDWQQFGRAVVARADGATRQRIEQSNDERVRYVAAQVGRELSALGITPNTNHIDRGRSWMERGDQGLGTCQHVYDSLRAALAGAGVEPRRLLLVYGQTAREWQRQNILDVNRNHVVLAFVREDGVPLTYDLWAHARESDTFDGFDRSLWNGMEARVWSKIMEENGYDWQACMDCEDDGLHPAALLGDALEKHAGSLDASAPRGAVRVFVRDDRTGNPLQGARVVVSGANRSPVEHITVSGTTDVAGAVNLFGVPVGPYTVTSSHPTCRTFQSDITHLRPGNVKTTRLMCRAEPGDTGGSGGGKRVKGIFDSPPAETKPAPATPGGQSAVSSEEEVVAEYRSLLPAVLQAEKKPWHTRIDIRANAVKQGSAYLVNYQTYCLTETGPDKGKDHACFEFNATLSAGELRSAVADFRRRLGR